MCILGGLYILSPFLYYGTDGNLIGLPVFMHTHPQFLDLVLFLKALANGRRIALLQETERRELTVEEAAQEIGTRVPPASRHLHILYKAGLIRSRKQGRHVLYRATPGVSVKKIVEFRDQVLNKRSQA